MKGFCSFVKRRSYNVERNAKDVTQIAVVFGASLCTFMMGVLLGWSSPSIPKLLEPEYGITMEEASYLTVMDPLAMIIGSPVFANLADRIGRRSVMFFVPSFFFTSFLIAALTKNIYILYITRVCAGLLYASSFSSVPTYIGEVTTPRIRSKYGHVLMTMVFAGQLMACAIGYYCDISTTAYIFFAVPIVTLVVLYFMPESPYYYIMKNNIEEARKSLEILRRTNNVDGEFNATVTAVRRQMDESGRFMDLFVIPSNRKALLVCNLVRAIQQLSGIAPLTAYCQYIFEAAGSRVSGGHAAVIFAGMLFVFNVFLNIICDKVGKRLAMVYSCTGICLAQLGMSTYFFLQEYTVVEVTPANWFPIVGLVVYVIFFCLGQANVPTLVLGELFSSNIKPHGVMFMNVAFPIYMASVNKISQIMMSNFGLCLPFFMFTVFAFVGIFLSYHFIPETKGKTLEEIQIMLKDEKM